MKTSIIKLLLAAASALASLGFATSAQAAPSAATYNFSGICSDCFRVGTDNIDQTVSATLVLQPFGPGGAVSASNFFSLVYDGSTQFSPFTILGTDVGVNVRPTSFPDGTAGQNVGSVEFWVSASVFLGEAESETPIYFRTFSDGRFYLGDGTGEGVGVEAQGPVGHDDFGYSHSWTLNSINNSNDVPEPGSLLLVGAALVAVGVARRRRA